MCTSDSVFEPNTNEGLKYEGTLKKKGSFFQGWQSRHFVAEGHYLKFAKVNHPEYIREHST